MVADKNDPKWIAHLAVLRALRSGALVAAERCETCGDGPTGRSKRLDAHHHHGYGGELDLDVQWLCRRCHVLVHSNIDDRLTHEQRVTLARRNFVEPNAKLTHEERSARSRRGNETRRARGSIVPWNKGKKTSDETRQRLSMAHRDQVPWNKGRKRGSTYVDEDDS